ncbi:MAG: hypothetical protein ACOCVC_02125 [Spirochaeta sp.]
MSRRGIVPEFLHGVRLEVLLQARGGFYAVYAAMTVVFLIIIALLPPGARAAGFGLIVLMDPSFMGFFFAGGLVLLEMDQGILPVIQTHGRGFDGYWRTKVGAILFLAVTVTGLLLLALWGLGFVQPVWSGILLLFFGVLLTVPVFYSLGLCIAGLCPQIINYFVCAGLVTLPFMFPFIELAGIPVGFFGVLSPVWGGMVLITDGVSRFAFGDSGAGLVRSAPELAAAAASLVVWNLAAYRLAEKAFAMLAAGQAGLRISARTRGPGKQESRYTKPNASTRLSPAMADIRLMLRDPIAIALLCAPLLASFMLGRVIPWLLSPAGPAAVVIPAAVGEGVLRYIDHIRSFALLLSVVMYGMIGAFLMLDEKDGGVLPFLRTLPGRPGWYLLRRGGFLLLMYAVMLPFAVLAGDLYHGAPVAFLASLLLDAVVLPVTFLGISIIAANKVQGLAMAKICNVGILPPLLMIPLSGSWEWTVGIFPTAWGSLLRLQNPGAIPAAAVFLCGAGYIGLIAVLLYRRACRLSGSS